MVSKNSDRILALLPFMLILLAGTVGIKTEIDLFSLSDCNPFLLQFSSSYLFSDR